MTKAAKFAAIGLALLALGAVFVPLLSPRDPLIIDEVVRGRFLPPFSVSDAGNFHVLGTDRFGRDLFARAFLAARISMLIGVLGSLAAATIGVAVGLLAGWNHGRIDQSLMAFTDALLAFPRLILLLLCVALWNPGAATVLVVLSITGWMSVARLVRNEVRGLRSRPFVEGAHALGVSPFRLALRHVLPNAIGPAIVAATLGVGNAILLESGLAFLGLGVQPPTPSWGSMIAGGREVIVTAPWVALVPGLALIVAVLCCTVLGDALRDHLAGERSSSLHGS